MNKILELEAELVKEKQRRIDAENQLQKMQDNYIKLQKALDLLNKLISGSISKINKIKGIEK